MFSIWIYCLLQIIPFFLAFVIGAAFLNDGGGGFREKWKSDLVVGLVTTLGFMLVFVPMGMPTTVLGKMAYKYVYLGNQFGGVLIGLIGFYFIGVLTLKISPGLLKKVRLGSALVFGMALAIAYKPCVTPTLTEIYNISRFAETSSYGGVLLITYSVGVFTVINAVAMLLIWAVSKISTIIRGAVGVKFAGAVMLVFSFMILGGYMSSYKSFLVGRFVSQILQEGMDHSDHSDHSNHSDHSDHMDNKGQK